MIFGMSTACFFPNIYTESAIDKMGEMNVENIEIFFSCLSEYKKSFAKDLKKRIQNNGMNVYSIHPLSLQFEPQLFSSHKRAQQDSLDIYRQVLESGAKLGAKVYVFHGPAHVKRAKTLKLNYSFIAETADYLAEIAKEYSIKLAWENVHWCWYVAPDFAKKISGLVNTDNLYFTLDIKQAVQAGYDPVNFLEMTNGRLSNIHMCDYEIDEQDGVCPRLPFKGEMGFERFKKALENINYQNAMMLEVYSYNYKDYEELSDNFLKMKSFFNK